MIYITAISMSPPTANDHQHIASLKWLEPGKPTTVVSSREQMVDWIRAGGDARVKDRTGDVRVGVVEADPPYLRTYADGRYTNNLLSLPRF